MQRCQAGFWGCGWQETLVAVRGVPAGIINRAVRRLEMPEIVSRLSLPPHIRFTFSEISDILSYSIVRINIRA